MVRSGDFDASVPLPPGLEISAIRRAIEYIERELADFVDLYFEQANVFSALVGIFGTKALDSVSNFEKHRHAHTAQQRFPDLCRRGARAPLSPSDCLESKGSKRPYAIQSHFDHPGWYIIWRYLVDPTESIETGKPIILWRVDVVFLDKSDWKYEGSTAGAAGGGRTHTFGVKQPAQRLRGKAVYKRSGIVLVNGKPVVVNGDDATDGLRCRADRALKSRSTGFTCRSLMASPRKVVGRVAPISAPCATSCLFLVLSLSRGCFFPHRPPPGVPRD